MSSDLSKAKPVSIIFHKSQKLCEHSHQTVKDSDNADDPEKNAEDKDMTEKHYQQDSENDYSEIDADILQKIFNIAGLTVKRKDAFKSKVLQLFKQFIKIHDWIPPCQMLLPLYNTC